MKHIFGNSLINFFKCKINNMKMLKDQQNLFIQNIIEDIFKGVILLDDSLIKYIYLCLLFSESSHWELTKLC